MNRLEGQRILVTGAASGIGQATVLRLLAEGASVVGADVAADG
jgi:NAD(P)-dependent dehydrogenase (short-subunit alcohol dehydrogenase family)